MVKRKTVKAKVPKAATAAPAEFKWVCIDINTRYSHQEDYDAVKKGMKNILGNDCSSILCVGDTLSDGVFDNAMETYIFIKCKNIFAHLKALQESKYVKNILNSFENVSYIPDSEIDSMLKSWEENKVEHMDVIHYGDLVQIKGGPYKNLFGIVIGQRKKGFEVLFKFCRGYDKAVVNQDNCVIQDSNLFTHVKVPVC